MLNSSNVPIINFAILCVFHILCKSSTKYQLNICFCLLFSRRTAMVSNDKDKILIQYLYLFKNYSARKLIKEFPEKG